MPEVRVPPRRLWPRSEVVETPGRGPGGSRFESGRSPHRTAGDLGSARSHTPCRRVRFPLPRPRAGGATGSAAPLQGEGCGFESRAVHAQRPADVAQLGEARRSDRRQCRFESDRQYHLDVAQWERTGFGSRGLGVRVSRPDQCEVVELVPRLALNQEVRVRTLASQPSMPLQLSRSLTVESACCAGGGSFMDP